MSFTAGNEDAYVLSRGFASSIRLDYQHYFWRDLLGFNIHPDIPVRDQSDVRIADIGAGTGIWLIHVSRQLHLSRLDGFDISTEQYPPKEWIPANISLQKFDALSPVPEELVGKYDVVHLRLLVVVVQNSDPSPILETILTMLKPGGYLQWDEYNSDTLQVVSSTGQSERSAMDEFVAKAKVSPSSSWVSKLSEICAKLGFIDTVSQSIPCRPDLLLPCTHLNLLTHEEISYKVMDNSSQQSSGPQLRKLILDAHNESKAGVGITSAPEVIVARKPF